MLFRSKVIIHTHTPDRLHYPDHASRSVNAAFGPVHTSNLSSQQVENNLKQQTTVALRSSCCWCGRAFSLQATARARQSIYNVL